MTVYRTCYSCAHRNDCSIKRDLAQAIKGRRVNSLSHSCSSYAPLLKPGQNVWAKVATGNNGIEKYAIFPAVFMHMARALGKAVVFIEPGAKSYDGGAEFTPMRNDGACSVSFAPLISQDLLLRDAWQHWRILPSSIIGLREGRTTLCGCGARPAHPKCCGPELLDAFEFVGTAETTS